MDGSDERTIADIIDDAYAVLDFPPGGAPDWERGDELYAPHAVLALRLFPSDPSVTILTWPAYKSAQLTSELKRDGYSETPGERRTRIVGDIAVVEQTFTMDFRGKDPVRAVDVFGLVRQRGRWRIISVLSDVTTESEG